MASSCSRPVSTAASIALPRPAESRSHVLKLDESKSERADLWPQFLPDGKHFVFYQQTGSGRDLRRLCGSRHRTTRQLSPPLHQPDQRRVFGGRAGFAENRLPAVHQRAQPDGTAVQLRVAWKSPQSPSRWPTISARCAVWRWRPSRSPPPACWSIRAWDSPPARWSGWIGPANRWPSPVHPAPGVRRGFRPTATAPLRPRPDPTARPRTSGCSQPDGGAQQIDGRAHARRLARMVAGRVAHCLLRQAGRCLRHLRPRAQPGSRPELLLKSADKKFPSDWSRDGKYIAYSVEGAGHAPRCVGIVGCRPSRGAHPGYRPRGRPSPPFPPDGKWLAYQSDQSGRNEVYVQAFDGLSNGTKRRWLVSKGGGLPAGAPTAVNCFT